MKVKPLESTLHELLARAMNVMEKAIIESGNQVKINLAVWMIMDEATGTYAMNPVGALLAEYQGEDIPSEVAVLDLVVIDKCRAVQALLNGNAIEAWKILYNKTQVTDAESPVYLVQGHLVKYPLPEFIGDGDEYFAATEKLCDLLKENNL